MQAGRQRSCHPACYPPRDRGQRCRRSFPASQGHEPRHQRCHGSCSYPPAVSCSLRTSSVMPRLITKSGTGHATASGAVWLRHLNASLLLYPDAVPGVPDKDHASKAVMVFASCPALSRLRCGTRTAPTLGAGLCAGSLRLSADLRGVEHPAEPAGNLDSLPSSGHPHSQIIPCRQRRLTSARETLGTNRDRPRKGPLPENQELVLYKIRVVE